MKKLALMFLLLQTPLILAADKKPNNPADFPVKLHITTSSTQTLPTGTGVYIQVLETVINGQPVRLEYANTYNDGLIALGDYAARISTKVHSPVSSNTYDIYLGYDLLMPDGKVRTYTVTRLGPAVPANP
jgi:hypothetical protein